MKVFKKIAAVSGTAIATAALVAGPASAQTRVVVTGPCTMTGPNTAFCPSAPVRNSCTPITPCQIEYQGLLIGKPLISRLLLPIGPFG